MVGFQQMRKRMEDKLEELARAGREELSRLTRPPPPPTAPQERTNPPYWRANFNPNTPVSAEWEHKLGNNHGWGNNELETYTSSPTNSFFTPDTNKLIIRAIASPHHTDPDSRFTSARLVSRRPLGRPRGSLTTHLSLPCAPGIWPAFWLLPQEPFAWPQDGEIDIAETWNGDGENHSCLHWGFHTPAERGKHRVRETRLPDMATGRPIRFDFVWDCPGGAGGRLMWCIDGRPVMRAPMPEGTRPMEDMCIILNVAMGGNGCGGQVPGEGTYDYAVHDIVLDEQPEGGWAKFERDWKRCQDGVVH
ncbi:concanavalin A-like lectin/glucanase domain-containing protein [Podospora conica]|nr:concanavalin A-like lectin/glucanase domain-containing protein [Schizothecium conicum]